MRISHTIAFALLAVVGVATGCNKGGGDEALLREEATNLRAQLTDRNTALEAANTERRDLAMQNAELRSQLEDATTRLGEVNNRTTGFEGIQGVTAEYGDGEVTVSIASDILFDSGKASLRTAAQRSLEQVSTVIQTQYRGKEIRIAGHTDSDPIKKSGWKSNYHLGAERAYAVMEFLQSKGLSANKMHIASFGPSKPMGSKTNSRRVEIVVLLNS